MAIAEVSLEMARNDRYERRLRASCSSDAMPAEQGSRSVSSRLTCMIKKYLILRGILLKAGIHVKNFCSYSHTNLENATWPGLKR
jgi:hypothetical protein